jgi:hypothetical protein
VRDPGKRLTVSLSIAVIVGELEQQFREESLPAGHRMQAGADSLPHPNAIPERPAVAPPVNLAQSAAQLQPEPRPDPRPQQYADPSSSAGRNNQALLELA